jgi:hypothetical protein
MFGMLAAGNLLQLLLCQLTLIFMDTHFLSPGSFVLLLRFLTTFEL